MGRKKKSGIDILMDEVKEAVSLQIKETVETNLKEYIDELKANKPLVVKTWGKTTQIKGLKHYNLENLIKLTGAGQNVMLVGMAGTGKTKGAEQTAEALGLKFYCISVGSQTSKSDLLGYIDANGKYVKTAFRDAYEKGGVFVMDEIDAGNSNVLIVLNSALSNDICAFPDKLVRRHKDFHFIATANTYGNGADRTYVGRNQLDGATLDRFTVLDWDIDESLEESLLSPFEHGKQWLAAVRHLRNEVKTKNIRAIISPRMSIKGATALDLGFPVHDVIQSVVLPQIPADRRDDISTNMERYYSDPDENGYIQTSKSDYDDYEDWDES